MTASNGLSLQMRGTVLPLVTAMNVAMALRKMRRGKLFATGAHNVI